MSPDDIHNERLKLFANWMNALGSGIVITGGVAPIIAGIVGLRPTAEINPFVLGALSLIWILVGFGLHWLARRSLRSLK